MSTSLVRTSAVHPPPNRGNFRGRSCCLRSQVPGVLSGAGSHDRAAPGSSQWLWLDAATIRGCDARRAQPGVAWACSWANSARPGSSSPSAGPSPDSRQARRATSTRPLRERRQILWKRYVDRGPGQGCSRCRRRTRSCRPELRHRGLRWCRREVEALPTSTPSAPSRPFPAPAFPGHHAPGPARRPPLEPQAQLGSAEMRPTRARRRPVILTAESLDHHPIG